MIKKYYFFLLIILLLLSNAVKSANIVVIDIDSLINNNIQYLEMLENINKDKEQNYNILNKNEEDLEKIFQEIESSKQILDERELNKIINEYNTMFEDFAKLVDAYNLHYENENILNPSLWSSMS